MVALGLGTAVLLRMFRLKELSTLQAVCSSYHCFLKSQNLPSCFNEIKCAISSIIVGSCPIKSMTIFFSSVAKCVVVLSHLKLVPAVRTAAMQKKLPSLSSAFPPKRKSVPRTCTDFLLHFQSRHDKLRFAVCICTCEENEGLQREHLFAAGFPIGARSIPVGTRFCFAKSSVLYLCFRLTRERGWRRTLRCGRVWQQTLFRGSRTGGFCDVSYSTNAGFLRSKIRLAGKGSRGI